MPAEHIEPEVQAKRPYETGSEFYMPGKEGDEYVSSHHGKWFKIKQGVSMKILDENDPRGANLHINSVASGRIKYHLCEITEYERPGDIRAAAPGIYAYVDFVPEELLDKCLSERRHNKRPVQYGKKEYIVPVAVDEIGAERAHELRSNHNATPRKYDATQTEMSLMRAAFTKVFNKPAEAAAAE